MGWLADLLQNRLALAATGSTDGTISIWDVQTQRLRQTLNHEVKRLAFQDMLMLMHWDRMPLSKSNLFKTRLSLYLAQWIAQFVCGMLGRVNVSKTGLVIVMVFWTLLYQGKSETIQGYDDGFTDWIAIVMARLLSQLLMMAPVLCSRLKPSRYPLQHFHITHSLVLSDFVPTRCMFSFLSLVKYKSYHLLFTLDGSDGLDICCNDEL